MSTTIDLYTESADLSRIYSEIYALAVETCHLDTQTAQRWAAWYAATGGHVELVQADFN